jgi:hypothetical protein
MQIQAAINGKALQSILKEYEIQECGIIRKNCSHSFSRWERCYSYAPLTWDSSELLLHCWNTKKCDCLPLSCFFLKVNVRIVACPWTSGHMHAHSCVYHWGHHRIWVDSVTTPTLPSSLCALRFFPVWFIEAQSTRTPLHGDDASQDTLHPYL